MHVFGHPCDLEGLQGVGKGFFFGHNRRCCRILGSFFYGKHTGTIGLLGILSFNGNKILTTGGGGAILTQDPKLAARAKHLTTTAKTKTPMEFYPR